MNKIFNFMIFLLFIIKNDLILSQKCENDVLKLLSVDKKCKVEKVGIVTVFLNVNKGCFIQSLALSEMLKRIGKKPSLVVKDISLLPKFFNRSTDYFNPIEQRDLNYSVLSEFSSFVSGSDIVWHPSIPKVKSNTTFFFLGFLENYTINKISYAASFAFDVWEYPEDKEILAKKYIKNFKCISVREDSGVTLAMENLGVKAYQHIDPSLVLDKSFYIDLIKKKNLKKRDIKLFGYILHPTAFKLNFFLEMARLLDVDAEIVANSEKDTSIEEWLNGFYSADYIITDSFHGCAFSINFNKSFLAFSPTFGKARIPSVLRLFNLTENLITEENKNNYPKYINILRKKVNYTKILEREREKSIDYLDRCLN